MATARDALGRRIQREVEAENRVDALAKLAGEGLTSIRLEPMRDKSPPDEPKASLLRRPSIGGVTRHVREARADVPVPETPAASPAPQREASLFDLEPAPSPPPRHPVEPHPLERSLFALDDDPPPAVPKPPRPPAQPPREQQAPPQPPRPQRGDRPASSQTAAQTPPESAPPRPQKSAAPPRVSPEALAQARATNRMRAPEASAEAPTTRRNDVPEKRPSGREESRTTDRLPTPEESRTTNRLRTPEEARTTNRLRTPEEARTTNRLRTPEEARPTNRLRTPEEARTPPEAPPPRSSRRRPEVEKPAPKPRKERPVDPYSRGMAAVDRLSFFSALSNMLTVGLPILRALDSLQEQYANRLSRAVMEAMASKLANGMPLSDAMAALPKSFSRLQIGSVRGAERSGRLADVLRRLHDYEERTLNTTRRIRSLLTYPLMVFGCALMLILLVGRSLMTGLIPALAQAKVQNSLMTNMVLGFARALDHPLVMGLLLAGIGGTGYLIARWLATPGGQARRDRTLLKVPFIRQPLRKVETARMCEALSTLYGAGLPLLECVDLTVEASTNVVAREALMNVRESLRNGANLSEAMNDSGFFEKTVAHMVSVGEETGRVEFAFLKIAQYNELEIREALEQLAAAIEPAMFLVLGVVVALIALVAFSPIYQLMNALT